MSNRFLAVVFVMCLYSLPVPGQTTITLHSLLQEMTTFESVAKFPLPAYTIKQASSLHLDKRFCNASFTVGKENGICDGRVSFFRPCSVGYCRRDLKQLYNY